MPNELTKPEPRSIAEATIEYDMPAEKYHAVQAVSASLLKRLYVSFPKKIHECPFESTEAMDNGTAFHSYLLDRDFHSRFFVMPDKQEDWRYAPGKIEKAQHEAVRAANLNKQAISSYTMQCIEGAYNEFRSHPFGAEIAGRIASKFAKTEVSMFWFEEREDGESFPCKARIDILDTTGVFGADGLQRYLIRDPKTTRNAHPLKFMWDVRPTKDGLNYWIQAAWYYRGAKKCGLDVAGVEFIAIELEKSYGITFHGMDEAELESAQGDVLRLAHRWQECVDSGVYGNYPAVRHMIAIGDNE